MKREQHKQVLHDIKDIFVDDFDVQNSHGQAPIISQLVQIFEQVNFGDIEVNEKLMAWSSKKFENNIMKTIVEKKVELHAHV